MFFWRWLRRADKLQALEVRVRTLQAELAEMDGLVKEMEQSRSVTEMHLILSRAQVLVKARTEPKA